MNIVVGLAPGGVLLTPESGAPELVAEQDFAARVIAWEEQHPRWVWDDTGHWYPPLLASGVRVERCVDLRLCHTILRNSALTSGSALATAAPGSWDRRAPDSREPEPREPDAALFELDDDTFSADNVSDDKRGDDKRGDDKHRDDKHGDDELSDDDPTGDRRGDDHPGSRADPVAEWALQQDAVAASAEPGRIGRLLAAESAGALIAAEMRFAGMPWRAEVHYEILAELLGPKPARAGRPEKLEALLAQIRRLLEVPDLNPDSPAELLKGLARGGVLATSTRSWELKKLAHPAIAPLLEYKKLSRLASANGWHWVDSWVADGRFRPDYVVGGVVTGRWATSGGGALQLPRQIRAAAVADDGWKLVVADAAQLEPRILAAMAGDRAMAAAGAAGDLYAGIVASGAIDTREHAKVALLAAMYGATQGDGGRLMPQLARAFPRAIAMVEEAARRGERGEIVTTQLGRSSPPPGEQWRDLQNQAYGEDATAAAASRARSYSRSWGRFTRNFIVQGTAAEWALCWMASLRNRLTALSESALSETALCEGSWLAGPHLVFFLHDELVVHTPAALAERVADEVRAAAQDAGRLLFGAIPVDFPLTVATVDNYGEAK